MKHLVLAALLMFALIPAAALAQPGDSVGEFLPVSDEELQTEQLPAAPLVFAAYSIVWLAFGAYAVSLWRRVSTVETELRAVVSRLEKGGR
jgi:CcmD family protein